MKRVYPLGLGTAAWLALATLAFAPVSLQAETCTFEFGHSISGMSPSGSAPWLTARFEDVSPGMVQLTLSAVGLTGSENVFGAYFNLNPSLSPANLSFTYQDGSGGFDFPAIATGVNAFKADGDGLFDINLAFNNAGTSDANRFTLGEAVVYQISYFDPRNPDVSLSTSHFKHVSAVGGGEGIFCGAAQIQRIRPSEGSGWIAAAVPEPSFGTFSLFGAALLLGCCWCGARTRAR